MGAIHFEVVKKSGDFNRYESLDSIEIPEDFYFIIKKEEGYHCATYSHYKAQVIDKQGNDSFVDYKGFVFCGFDITGNASEYILRLNFELPQGQGTKQRVFKSDISYNTYYEDYKTTKPEWDGPTQYKDILGYFDDLEKYGVEAYDRILELEREAYRQKALCEREKFDHETYKKHIDRLMECVKEFFVPETVEYIYSSHISMGLCPYIYNSIERVFLPSSLKFIETLPFSGGDNLKQVFCMAGIPPRISRYYRQYGPETELYVPKDSLQAYKDDESWAKCFTIIKGF